MLEELMKTGLFELRIEKSGDWVITPLIEDVSVTIYDGEEWGSESNFPFEYPKGWAESNPEFTDEERFTKNWSDDIPWHEIPDKFNWVAMDKSGNWFAHEDKPEVVKHREWVNCDLHGYVEGYHMPSPPHWTESLVRRPSYE